MNKEKSSRVGQQVEQYDFLMIGQVLKAGLSLIYENLLDRILTITLFLVAMLVDIIIFPREQCQILLN